MSKGKFETAPIWKRNWRLSAPNGGYKLLQVTGVHIIYSGPALSCGGGLDTVSLGTCLLTVYCFLSRFLLKNVCICYCAEQAANK